MDTKTFVYLATARVALIIPFINTLDRTDAAVYAEPLGLHAFGVG
jgi:hypothetical protein